MLFFGRTYTGIFLWHMADSLWYWWLSAYCILLYEICFTGFKPLSICIEYCIRRFYGSVHLPDAWSVRNAFYSLYQQRPAHYLSEMAIADSTFNCGSDPPCDIRLSPEHRLPGDL